MPHTPLPDAIQEYLARCRRLIAEHGHLVQSVASDGVTPPWAYTVGLSQAGGAELVVIGLDPPLAQLILNNIGRRLQSSTPETVDLTGIVNVALRLCRTDEASVVPIMKVASALLAQPPQRVWLVQWADEGGHFPGQPGYRHFLTQTVADLQPPSRPD